MNYSNIFTKFSLFYLLNKHKNKQKVSYFICKGSKKMKNYICVKHEIFHSFTFQTNWRSHSKSPSKCTD